jgi:hypothetical protein
VTPEEWKQADLVTFIRKVGERVAHIAAKLEDENETASFALSEIVNDCAKLAAGWKQHPRPVRPWHDNFR